MSTFLRRSFHLRQPAFSARFFALALASLLIFATGQAQAWSLDDVAGLARAQAQAPFQPASHAIPAELTNLDYDGYRDIRFNPDHTLWRADKLPFEANFFHVGRLSDAVRIHEITPQGIKPIPYNPADFNFGKNKLSPQTWGDLGYGGLRTFSNLNSADHKDELVVFSGASYFRALGAGQRYGLSARGLAVDTSGASQEEFPRFTEFWLEKPSADAKQLTIYALMDSPRMTGAYRFDVTPGEQTISAVHARIFMRATDKPVTTLGLAPLTSMFFFGENQTRAGDFRPEVHDSDGLMIATGDGEWLWRPLQNPAAAITTSFSMTSLKGFGLMQRDRAFHSYEDTEARYELRPSAWITPLGDWGAGRVELLQFGIPDETHDNVAAYWVPASMPQPGQSMDFAYTIAWQGQNQQLPPNGWVTQTRRGTGFIRPGTEAVDQQIQFVVDFAGPALDVLPDDTPVQAIATANANGRVTESLAYKNSATGAWRMTLRVQRLNPALPVELRAFLQYNNQTLSETWTNLITP
ncbi:glucan biosynthesis protein G [Rhodoferax sp.]|uniref:glucan biosynthesis protein G n=1 Tax=Rhodoferax sp. TaxID=50421 RepID=UPI002842367D|nr:glucan biosynthesis protein G [Rhodoferax sp.]MDR3368020.1 glucan biosynthesis protein G [Rhodoferax sp.]